MESDGVLAIDLQGSEGYGGGSSLRILRRSDEGLCDGGCESFPETMIDY